jgi:hypothetical protein
MQEPTEDDDDDDEASISTENEREDPNLNSTDGTFSLQRKAAKRTLPWDLAVDELELMSPQQNEDIRAMKRPRLEEPSSASTDEAWTELSSHETAVSLPAPADVDSDANTDPVKVKGVTGSWTPEEDAKLNSAVTNTGKKKYGKEYHTSWVAVAALVPGRTAIQCKGRWKNALNPNIDPTTGRTGRWTEDEDSKLKDAILAHGGNDWAATSALGFGSNGKAVSLQMAE